MKCLALAFFALVALLSRVSGAEDLTKEPPTELEGEWRPRSIVSENEPVPAERLAEMTFTFRGALHVHAHKTLEIHKSKAKFRVDPSKTPKEIDFVVLDESEPSPNIAAIYKLEGDELTIVFDRKARTVRPKAFPSAPTQGIDVIVLQRARREGK